MHTHLTVILSLFNVLVVIHTTLLGQDDNRMMFCTLMLHVSQSCKYTSMLLLLSTDPLTLWGMHHPFQPHSSI
jgi:hypothetical protein